MSKIIPQHIQTLYGATAKIPKGEDTFAEFSCHPIPVIQFIPSYGDCFEVEGVHHISSHYQSSFIPIHMLNKEHKINEEQYTFFSEDITKCISWLEKIKQKSIAFHNSQYETLKATPIEISEDCQPSFVR